jgi:hypothetical protein
VGVRLTVGVGVGVGVRGRGRVRIRVTGRVAVGRTSTHHHTLRPVRPSAQTTLASVSSMKRRTERETMPIISRLKLELGLSMARCIRLRGFLLIRSASIFLRAASWRMAMRVTAIS